MRYAILEQSIRGEMITVATFLYYGDLKQYVNHMYELRGYGTLWVITENGIEKDIEWVEILVD